MKNISLFLSGSFALSLFVFCTVQNQQLTANVSAATPVAQVQTVPAQPSLMIGLFSSFANLVEGTFHGVGSATVTAVQSVSQFFAAAPQHGLTNGGANALMASGIGDTGPGDSSSSTPIYQTTLPPTAPSTTLSGVGDTSPTITDPTTTTPVPTTTTAPPTPSK